MATYLTVYLFNKCTVLHHRWANPQPYAIKSHLPPASLFFEKMTQLPLDTSTIHKEGALSEKRRREALHLMHKKQWYYCFLHEKGGLLKKYKPKYEFDTIILTIGGNRQPEGIYCNNHMQPEGIF